MIHVFRKRNKRVFIIYPAAAPGFGFRFKRTHHQFPGIFLVISAFIGNPHHRHIAGQGVNGFGDDVEMFAGMQRNVDADRFPQMP